MLCFYLFEKLRVRDLEGALEVEKSEVKEVKYNLDMLTKQHRFVHWEILKLKIEQFSIDCRKKLRVCLGFALLGSVIG